MQRDKVKPMDMYAVTGVESIRTTIYVNLSFVLTK